MEQFGLICQIGSKKLIIFEVHVKFKSALKR